MSRPSFLNIVAVLLSFPSCYLACSAPCSLSVVLFDFPLSPTIHRDPTDLCIITVRRLLTSGGESLACCVLCS
ncbi:uncharacterized protein LAESUDRAFT_808493, partial [Laetiporus sulphureus 93-53]